MEDLEIPKKNLARNLRELRNRMGLSQSALADKLDVSMRTIQQIEQGNRFTTDDLLAKLGAFFRVSVSDLLREEGAIAANAPAQTATFTGQIPAQLLFLIARLSDQPEAIEMLLALSAKFLGIPVESTNRGHEAKRRS